MGRSNVTIQCMEQETIISAGELSRYRSWMGIFCEVGGGWPDQDVPAVFSSIYRYQFAGVKLLCLVLLHPCVYILRKRMAAGLAGIEPASALIVM